MTPEERFIKIENLLQAIVEKQVEFESEHGKIQSEQKETATQLRQLTEQVNRTAAAQEVTEKRLQELIAHVDGIDGRLKKLEDNGSQ